MSGRKRGLILLVHGSRDRAWMEPFEELRKRVAAAAEVETVIACLQFCPPDVEAAARELGARGVKEALLAPVFISTRGHVLRDVPAAVERARRDFPDLEITLAPALGEQPEVAAAFLAALVRLAKGG